MRRGLFPKWTCSWLLFPQRLHRRSTRLTHAQGLGHRSGICSQMCLWDIAVGASLLPSVEPIVRPHICLRLLWHRWYLGEYQERHKESNQWLSVMFQSWRAALQPECHRVCSWSPSELSTSGSRSSQICLVLSWCSRSGRLQLIVCCDLEWLSCRGIGRCQAQGLGQRLWIDHTVEMQWRRQVRISQYSWYCRCRPGFRRHLLRQDCHQRRGWEVQLTLGDWDLQL